MGYYTRFHGEIGIDPPLTSQQITDNSSWNDSYPIMINRALDKVVPTTDDDMKAYSIVTDMENLINDFPDNNFNGHFDCEGEEAGDLWRLVVNDRVVTTVKPKIVWPEDE